MITKTAILIGTTMGAVMADQIKDIDNDVRDLPTGRELRKLYGLPSEALKAKHGLGKRTSLVRENMKRGAVGEVIGGAAGLAGALAAGRFIKNPTLAGNIQLASFFGGPIAGASIGTARYTPKKALSAYARHVNEINSQATAKPQE